jgi:hypothetical protein
VKIVVSLLLFCAMTSQAEAQLFRRRVASVQSYGHWSYPGDIATHLATTHGRTVAGLTREQMLNLHDALHEGRSIKMAPSAKPIKILSDYEPRLQPFKPIVRTEVKQPEPVIIKW